MASRVVRCKMVVTERKEFVYWGSTKTLVGVKLSAVTGREEDKGQLAENKRFYEASPSGTVEFATVEFATVEFAAAEGLEVGAEYYVDIVKPEGDA